MLSFGTSNPPLEGAAPAQDAAGALPAAARPLPSAALGATGITVTRLGLGTGSTGVDRASLQVRLGAEQFCALVRHCWDQGIRLFDAADDYGSHVFLREALSRIRGDRPAADFRDTYVIQTKITAQTYEVARSHVERILLELGESRLDSVLLHCMQEPDWPDKMEGAMRYLSEAKAQGLIRAHGVSCHGLEALRTAAGHDFVEVLLARINHAGEMMDWGEPQTVAAVLQEARRRHKGVIGMKLFGNGAFRQGGQRDASFQYVFQNDLIDAGVIGFCTPEQVDDGLARLHAVLGTRPPRLRA